MKVSNDVAEMIVEAVVANCVKRDGQQINTVKLAVRNVLHYMNKLNRDLKPDQTVYGYMNLSDMMLTSGLASILWPRRVQYDVNNRLQKNLIYQEEFTHVDVACYKLVKEVVNEDDGKGNINKKDKWSEVEVEYGYSEFLQDLTLIKVAMRCSEIQLNTSVAQAVRDIDVLSVVDRLVINDNVKWSGAVGSEFIPIRVNDSFSVGLVEEEYYVNYKDMLKSLFASQVKDFFTK